MPERTVGDWLAAGFGSGWLPKAPGTWGSLVALMPAWLIVELGGVPALAVATLLILAAGCFICSVVLPKLEAKDPGWIVIDEWAGQWLTLAVLIPFLGGGWVVYIVAFIAFRLFDILKPWPISRVEKQGPDWWSIMADDLVAGLIGAGIVIVLAEWAGL